MSSKPNQTSGPWAVLVDGCIMFAVFVVLPVVTCGLLALVIWIILEGVK